MTAFFAASAPRGLLRPSAAARSTLRLLSSSAARCQTVSISQQEPEQPHTGKELEKAHARTAGKTRGTIIAERAAVSGGPGADRVA